MDRIYGFNLGRQVLPNQSDKTEDLLEKFCQRCGHFDRRLHQPVSERLQSQTWKAAYARYRVKLPKLTKYGEKENIKRAESKRPSGLFDGPVGNGAEEPRSLSGSKVSIPTYNSARTLPAVIGHP